VTDSLVGVWELLEWRTELVDGKTDHPFGPDALGQLVYTADGYLAGQIMSRDRRTFSRPRAQAVQFDTGNAGEIVAAFNTFLSYAGRWEHGTEGMIHHHVTICSIPGWAGTTLDREAKIREPELVLRTPPRVINNVTQRGVLRWRRLA
jgi:hypothetical protein